LKKTLKEHRLQAHLSQQELAASSGISLRTIQRIERGDSAGSPYVIRTLCESLGIDPQDLVADRNHYADETAIAMPEPAGSADMVNHAYDRRLKYINFSAISALCFPFLNLVLPAVLYFAFKKSVSGVHNKEGALKILSLQILWSVFTLISMIFIPVVDLFLFGIDDLFQIPLFVWGYLVLVILLVLITLKTASDINNKKQLLVFVPNIL
jgi:transcriptional regulator with XRE-family HTH domain